MKDWNLLVGLAILAVWVILLIVLPKIGVPT
jgi:hypothetical protein